MRHNYCFVAIGAIAKVAGGVADSAAQISNMVSNKIAGGNTSKAGNVINGVGDALGSIPIVGKLAGAGIKRIGAIVNKAFGSNVDQEAVDSTSNTLAELSNNAFGATSLDQLAQNSQSMGALGINNMNLGTQGWFNKDVDNARAKLQEKQNAANRQIAESAMDMTTNSVRNAVSAYTAAFGGPLLCNDFFTDGVTLINNGGTHESNPYGGVLMGIAPDGLPNFVEQDEVIYNDYVYSNRIKLPKKLSEKYKLGNDITFADAFKKLRDDERPNDLITRNGLNDIAQDLALNQEQIRQRKQMATRKNYAKKYLLGGLTELIGGAKDQIGEQAADLFSKDSLTTLGNLFSTDTTKNPLFTKDDNSFAKGGHMYSGEYPLMSNELKFDTSSYIPYTSKEYWSLSNPYLGFNKYTYKPSFTYTKPSGTDSGIGSNFSFLRYAPIAANLTNVITDAAGITNKPTKYNVVSPYKSIEFSPIGDYVSYNPFDRNYYTNMLRSQTGATSRGLTSDAARLALDYTSGLKFGELARQGEEYNLNQRFKNAEFNRGTNQFNAEGKLKADIANSENRYRYDNNMLRQSMLNDESYNNAWQGRMTNASNLMAAVGSVGKEQDALKMANAVVKSSVPLNEYFKAIYGANGGTIRRKKSKKNLTY